MPNTPSIENYDNSDGGLASASAAADPVDVFRHTFDRWNPEPWRMIPQNGIPPVVNTRWNPDMVNSTDTANVLNMIFYKRLDEGSTNNLIANGITMKWGVIYMPDESDSTSWNKWSNVGDDIAWGIAETSNNDGAMMLAQGLAAGAALLAAFSF